MTELISIRNIGPTFADALTAVGIKTAEELRALGADVAYCKLLEGGTKPHFIGYYVLHMALQGRPWNDCKGEEKKKLRKRFDTLKAKHFDQDQSEFERILDQIGVVASKRLTPELKGAPAEEHPFNLSAL
ncbi:TfoX/Sxy family protein [Cognatiyoonia sp.]|uniref:TfoX/Sxy family protein n=1 Tax=Cognatiyoonia sp. TaxID=2211652 RepID=UPI003F6A319B